MKIKLKDICEVKNGYAFKSDNYTNSGIRVIRITNVQKGFVEDEHPEFYPLSYSDELNDYMLQENDLLLSLTGNVGRVALLNKEFLPAALNQRVACLRTNNEKILNKYLFYYLLSKNFENDCIKYSKGIAQKNMSTEWLKEYELDIVSINEQNSIICIFDKLYRVINKYKIQLNHLDTLIKARFVEMFGNIDDTKKWERKKWQDVVEIRNGKDYKKVLIKKGGYPVYGTGGEMARASEYLCPENTIVVGRKGSINNPLLVKEKFWNVDTAFGVVVKKELNYQYLYQFCKSFNFMKLNKATTLPSTTKEDLLKIEINLPPIDLQNQFAIFVNQVDKLKFDVQKSLEKTQMLLDSLMQEYFG